MNLVATFLCLLSIFIIIHAHSDNQLNGKIAIVTGGAKGIGHAIVDHYLKNGIKTVIIVDKNLPRGIKAEKNLNDIHGANRVVFMYGDITKDLDDVSRRILETYGCVDILVNNAGVLDENDPEKTMTTNALGTVMWSHRFFECMRKDKGGKGGTIMNVASVSAFMRDPFVYYFKASEYAIFGLTVGMGHLYNYMSSGVRVFALCSGLTRTDMTQNQQMTMDRHVDIFDKFSKSLLWQDADDVGEAAALLFTTARTGMAYTVEGGAPAVVSPDRRNVTNEDLLNII